MSLFSGLYQYVDIEGFVWSEPFAGAIALNTYYNGHDNMLASQGLPGYTLVRTEGYAWPNTTANSSLVALSLYYNTEIGDHFSTRSLRPDASPLESCAAAPPKDTHMRRPTATSCWRQPRPMSFRTPPR